MGSEAQKSQPTNMKLPVQRRLMSRRLLLRADIATAILAIIPLGAELRIEDADQPLSNNWSQIPIEPRGPTLLGISFRPNNARAFGLDIRPTLNTLLEYPIQIVRLGAYWNKIELSGDQFDTSELDW